MKIKYIIITITALLFISCAKQDSVSVAQKELARFYNYSTVDWCRIDTLYYRPYNCDWPDEIAVNHDFSLEDATRYWHRLQNAKTYLHQQTLPLRIGASDAFIEQLNHTEAALDSVFVNLITQEFYLRAFVDCYQEIMPQEITKCFELQ